MARTWAVLTYLILAKSKNNTVQRVSLNLQSTKSCSELKNCSKHKKIIEKEKLFPEQFVDRTNLSLLIVVKHDGAKRFYSENKLISCNSDKVLTNASFIQKNLKILR